MRTLANRGLLLVWGTLLSVGVCGVGRADDTKKGNDSAAPTAVQAAPEKNGVAGGAAGDSMTSAPDDAAASSSSANPDIPAPQGTQQPAGGQASGINSNYVLKGNFFERLVQFYHQDWAGTNPSATLPAKRGLPAPLDSPPFPSSDWIYGGAPDIGAPDGNTYPLMTALGLENSRIKVYGWVATSINFSTSGHNNFPVSYDIFPNKIELNQAVIYVERLPDTVQNDHFDWGFHVTAFEGIDYRFTTAKGYFSQQLLKFNHQYGFDPVLEYVDLYFPVKDGLDIRRQTFGHLLFELFHKEQQRQFLRLRERHQRRQVRLQQPAGLRLHVVPQVQQQVARGDRGLVHV